MKLSRAGLRGLYSHLNGWVLSLLLHGAAVTLAALSISRWTPDSGSGPAPVGDGWARAGSSAGSYTATLFREEEKVPGGASLPEDPSLGPRVSPELSLEPPLEDAPFSRASFDFLALDPAGPAAARAPEPVSDRPAENLGGVWIDASRRDPHSKPGVHAGPPGGLAPGIGKPGTGILSLGRKREPAVAPRFGTTGFAPVPGPGARISATPLEAFIRIPQGLYSALRTPRAPGGLWRSGPVPGPLAARPPMVHGMNGVTGWNANRVHLPLSGLSGTGIRIVLPGMSGLVPNGPRIRAGAASINGTEIRLRH